MFYKQRYHIKKFFLNIRYKIILWLVGKMPVIVNCTIYDDVMEFNFGKTRTYKPCICFNNKVKRFDRAVETEIERRRTSSDENVLRKNNSFVLCPAFNSRKEN
jgi:hypothetical protein